MTGKERMLKAIRFYMNHSDKWITFATDKETVETICCLNNLRILNINNYGQAKINRHNAELYLNTNGSN